MRCANATTRLFTFKFTLAWLLVASLSNGQKLQSPETTSPTIVVGSIMVSDFSELSRKVKILDDASCNGGSRYLEHPTTVQEFIGVKVTTIRVVNSAPRSNPPTAEEVQKILRRVWQGKFQSSFCQIVWSEPTFWSIESIVEFEDGKQSLLITDGVHVALQDHDGKNWFFRLFPAAQ